ncbi:LTA synthase family protein [Paenibacillus psychroresistens]|uniref:LTA synthase family protein n=1 Tax=Paenibacillus psychroresistens TaxID=1778678 RepID=A0A6B8RD06_9BACL|nr:LTA synthase family protein [Paenibacillus psychroresistens]QGQ94050.1 LTA synthase family protein [Paenibacillus psychroresistens]
MALLKLGNRRFIIFTLILALKGCLAWFVVFEDGPSWGTILTEIPFFWVMFTLIEWFAKERKLFYYLIVNLLITVLYFAVLMYYKYYGIIATYHALNQMDKVTKVGESTYSLLDPYYLLIFIDIIVFAVILLRKRIKLGANPFKLIPMRKSVLSLVFILSITSCLFSILPNKASMNENKKAEEMGILNYELYTVLSDSNQEIETVPMASINLSAIKKLKGIETPLQPQYFGKFKNKNLIIVQLESFQNFLIDLKVDGQEITPNINKLAKENIDFDNFYTMVGQGTTSDAEYVVNTSLYVPEHEAATDHFVDKALPSLPKLLLDNGFTTATFHTNKVEFWNRQELYTSLGWEHYYDQSFFGDDDHIAFGASDEILYSKTVNQLEKMDQSAQPFYAQMITMSAHHPYTIPESKIKMKLPEPFKDNLLGNYLQAQNYADYALGQFIANLKSRGLWDDSIILFYGDHQGLPLHSLSKDELELMHQLLGRAYTNSDMFNIPLIIHTPDVAMHQVIENTGGQIDILPTVANLLGVSLENQIYFGEDLLNQTTNLLPMRHFLPTGSFITDLSLFLPGIAYEDGVNYSLAPVEGSAFPATEQQYENALELLRLSDSYVTQLPDK